MEYKRTIQAAIAFVVLTSVSPIFAATPSSAPAWSQDYALIVPARTTLPLRQQIDRVEALGAHISIVVNQDTWLGWVPAGVAQKLRASGFVRGVALTAADLDHLPQSVLTFREAADYWLDVVKGTHRVTSFQWQPPQSDVMNDGHVDLTVPETMELQNAPNGNIVIRSCRWENCYMSGLTAIAVFFVESNGLSDLNTYTWNVSAIESTRTQLLDGANFWSSEASARGISLTFVYEWYSPLSVSFATARSEVFEPYEPIQHPWYGYPLWVDSIMSNLQVTGSDTLTRVKYFNSGLKSRKGSQRVYSVFIGYNPSPAPDQFGNNVAAFVPRFGGPMVQMLFRNFTGTTFADVFAHESGHAFYACDEYIPACDGSKCNLGCYSSTEGPRPAAPNANCEACAGSVLCIMRGYVRNVCQSTAAQIGW